MSNRISAPSPNQLASSAPSPSQLASSAPKRKPWKDVSGQIQRLRDRELSLSTADEITLTNFLKENNYYRFSGYFRQFYIWNSDPNGGDYFIPETTLAELLEVYYLDDLLREHLYVGLRKIELFLRNKISYNFAQVRGVEDRYHLPSMYKPTRPSNNPPDRISAESWRRKHAFWVENRDILLSNIKNTLERDEKYLEYFKKQGQVPPLWAAVDAFSFGDLARMLEVWRDDAQVNSLARELGFAVSRDLRKAVGNINYFRNIVAHHGRIMGRSISRSVVNPPWVCGKQRLSFDILPDISPMRIILLINNWVDYISGDNDYSEQSWKILEMNETYLRKIVYPTV